MARSWDERCTLPVAGTLLALLCCSSSPAFASDPSLCDVVHPARQFRDGSYLPTAGTPRYRYGEGPLVLVDHSHANFHRITTSYWPFGELLRQDGYRLEELDHHFDRAELDDVDIIVIPSALRCFKDGEIETLDRWVAHGGPLLLIADHKQFGRFVHELGRVFGVRIENFTITHDGRSCLPGVRRCSEFDFYFTPSPSEVAEGIGHVTTYGGTAFGFDPDVHFQSILTFADDAFDRDSDTPIAGLSQGAFVDHGLGGLYV